ncbi:lytic transglycosylase domain-containing protein [Pelagicoccus sp. SDUM812002]|uniref:lytic transglycosylase domain-containing protein n=1 Tax=Pelagicoccus sp. SDUM812002 TaxID=3041266 RepID=UPI00280D803D|nr:lytic transglycosylase domain-containing protein [Pelagicoccus sp. SDUM812002]MDQ8185796.1 lytic transglycosylase domain-containing protein [Pelagicoccus sp. SDUM812002]
MPHPRTAKIRVSEHILPIPFFAYLILLVASPTSTHAQSDETIDDLLRIGQELWEEHAPPELQDQYRLPTMDEIETFLADFESDLVDGNVQRLAAYAPQARIALSALRQFQGGDSLADWLEPRIDYLEAAEAIVSQPPAPAAPERPAPPPLEPQYTQAYWMNTLATRPMPEKAKRYMPVFKKAFQNKGLPPELAWLSEVESSLNLQARSPVGAYGPFQFMPATAKRFGLKIGSPDERADPRKSAEAAASYLSILYKQFNSWPLALAAYNAGEGRVGRALEAANVETFDEVAAHLPTETRMYVPKVLATISARESIDATTLPGIATTHLNTLSGERVNESLASSSAGNPSVSLKKLRNGYNFKRASALAKGNRFR